MFGGLQIAFLFGTAIIVPLAIEYRKVMLVPNQFNEVVEMIHLLESEASPMQSRDKDLVNELEAIKTDVTNIRENLTAELNNLADEIRELVQDNINKERNGLDNVDEETKMILNSKDKADFEIIVNIKEEIAIKLEEMDTIRWKQISEIKADILVSMQKRDNSIRPEIDQLNMLKSQEKKAFTTSLTSSRLDLSFHMPIIYSTVITDTSARYNPSDGIFTIPASGVYVFTWAASCGIGCSQDTEFVVDSIAYGCLKVDAVEKQYFGSSIQTVVLEV